MSSSSVAHYPDIHDKVMQGDIYCDVKYSYIDKDSENEIQMVEYIFPYAIVLSQSCDVSFMDDFENGLSNSPAKFMPGILMCAIYNKDKVKMAGNLVDVYAKMGIQFPQTCLYTNEDKKVAEKDQHVRYHALKVIDRNGENIMNDAVVDLKHVFTVPIKQLQAMRENKRLCSLDDLYANQIAVKLYAYMARIGLPD